MTLVVDASVAVAACLADAGFELLPDRDLVAPSLMWSETRSVLHELIWRREVSGDDGVAAVGSLAVCPVRRVESKRLGPEAWQIADELGWAKTYDAEYVALASLLDCSIITLDRRLARGAERLNVEIVLPGSLD